MISEENFDYQWEKLARNPFPKKELSNWSSSYGPRVVERGFGGSSFRVEFSLLIDNSNVDVFVVGDFNGWNQDLEKLEKYKLKLDKNCVIGRVVVEGVYHKCEYKFLVVDRVLGDKFLIQDPAAVYFTDFGNCVFWDFDDYSCYKMKYDFVDNLNRSIKILQTDLPGLVSHFCNKDGVCGKDVELREMYKFIATSGVIDEIKSLGFNSVQFLPFSQSIDGDNWKFRYLVPFQFAVQKNWGTPDDFAFMVDMFHKSGISVIGDFVLGHLPDRDYEIFGQDCSSHGIHQWKKADGSFLYMKEETPWGTRRVDFDNPYVRDFFISSVVHFMRYYKVDGFRVDNVDGIIRFGDSGEGDERTNGRTFLRELNSAIYSFNPASVINFESHFFYGDNARMLVAPLSSDERALGASAYNSSRLTYYFHTQYMFKGGEEISVWRFKDIFDDKVNSGSNSTVSDFHNHDAAAGLMNDRCTGAFALNCLGSAGVDFFHSLGKVKVMEGIVSFLGEGRTLDLVQTFLMQPGTFEHNSSVEWFLTMNRESRALLNYKRDVNLLMDDEAFWPRNVCRRKFLNVDDKNKVLVVQRSGRESDYLVVVNVSSSVVENYSVGVFGGKKYEVVFNSDKLEYLGTGIFDGSKGLDVCSSDNFEFFDREVVLDVLPPYGVIVLKGVH